jgi:hypothetical protein
MRVSPDARAYAARVAPGNDPGDENLRAAIALSFQAGMAHVTANQRSLERLANPKPEPRKPGALLPELPL